MPGGIIRVAWSASSSNGAWVEASEEVKIPDASRANPLKTAPAVALSQEKLGMLVDPAVLISSWYESLPTSGSLLSSHQTIWPKAPTRKQYFRIELPNTVNFSLSGLGGNPDI